MTETLSTEHDLVAAREAFERCIGEGGVALFPADGLYGLACDPLEAKAVERINAAKGRDPAKPSAVMFFDEVPMDEMMETMTPLVRAVVAKTMPGPVTLVIDNPEHRFPLACGATPERLGVRFIAGRLAGAMHPVLQTSANRSGEPPPARFEDVPDEIRVAVDLAIDGGELTGEPSTVVDLTEIESGGQWKIIREGGMSYDELERVITEIDLG